MPRGNNGGNGRGAGNRGGRGGNNNNHRGGGFRGRGGRGRGRGGGGGGGYIRDDISAELDFVLQRWPEVNTRGASPRGINNRGGGHTPSRNRGASDRLATAARVPVQQQTHGYDSPRDQDRGRGRGRGDITPGRGRGRGGRGRGNASMMARMDGPLSAKFYEERPFLRPVIFVASTATPFLFQEEEEIFQPVVEEVGIKDEDHVPTADTISRIFSGMSNNIDEDESGEEQLEEVHFQDIGRIQVEVESAEAANRIKQSTLPPSAPALESIEQQFTGIRINTAQEQVVLKENYQARDRMEPELLPASPMLITPRAPSNNLPSLVAKTAGFEPEEPPFFIDTTPSEIPISEAPTSIPRLATLNDDDEVIVYVAPHPRSSSSLRSGRHTPVEFKPATTALEKPETLVLPQTSILTGTVLDGSTSNSPLPTSGLPSGRTAPPSISSVNFSSLSTPNRHKATIFLAGGSAKTKLRARIALRGKRKGKKGGGRKGFSSFGAAMQEAQLYKDGVDERYNERRNGDSDIDWGGESDDDDIIGAGRANGKKNKPIAPSKGGKRNTVLDDALDMELDPEVEFDLNALTKFAKGMAPGGHADQFMTIDDIEDQKRMEEEDREAEAVERGSSGEEEEEEAEIDVIVNKEEGLMMGEGDEDNEGNEHANMETEDFEDDDEDEGDEDDDLDGSPKTNFEARLKRLREAAKGKKPQSGGYETGDDDDDDEEDDYDNLFPTKAQEDEEFAAQIQAMLDDNVEFATSKNRKERKEFFRDLEGGNFSVYGREEPDYNSKQYKGKDRATGLPPDLQLQWEADRERKAENKRLRAAQRLALAADPLSPKKGGKKGLKSMLAAARSDPTTSTLPNRVIDMTTLVQQIRRFIADISGPRTMSLPPTDKSVRKEVHELAQAFYLKSKSMGKGEARYTMLTKTTKAGAWSVDEKKVGRIVRRSGGRGYEFVSGSAGGVGGKGKTNVREGEAVGLEAPKIDKTNLGFKLLASMGWKEGDRIGLSGGLEIPLVAIMKKSKLGLGAANSR